MATEIERKFLITGDGWREGTDGGRTIRQGYLTSGGAGTTVRVRIKGSTGYLTIKGATEGVSREEFEYEIPREDAEQMLQTLCSGGRVDKVRYEVLVGDRIWEVDVFEGANEGLVVAEVELEGAEQEFERPPWCGREVSHDARFFNAALARRPYCDWGRSK